MRILLWPPLYKPVIGGIERYTERLAIGLMRHGCTVEVITNSVAGAAPEETINGLNVTRLPFPASRQGDLAAVRAVRDGLRRVSERLQPELLNLHTGGPSLIHYALHRRALPIPVVTTFHGIYPADGEFSTLLSQHITQCAGIIATSMATKQSLCAAVGDAARVTAVHLPPIDDAYHRPTVARPRNGAVVLGVGRLVVEKGWQTLLDAFSLVLEQVPHAQLVLAGDGDDRGRLEALVSALGLGDAVTFRGIVGDQTLIELFDACNVVCMPSHIAEGFGMVAVEASRRARPVVATVSGGLVEAVVDGTTGLLVPVADANALAGALIDVLTDSKLADRLGANGREVAGGLTIDAIAGATLASFERALSSGRI